MNEPRPYRNVEDLEAMLRLLMAGRKAKNGSYYIHTGDLRWWLYYPPLEGAFWDHIYLWADPQNPDRLLGWALISPDWVGFDVYIQPELQASTVAREMYIWAEEQALHIARTTGKSNIYALWISHDDVFLGEHFWQRGFRLGRGMVHLTRSMDVPIAPARLQDDFIVRGCKGMPEVTARARAQYGAFQSKALFERYLERFTNFMVSPVYDPHLDIVAVAPDEQVGAFCIGWTDPVNKVGLFEPVGTHPDFQRKGLASAVMQEGMRRMYERGMTSAIVSTYEDNPAAIKLYQSLGFRIENRLGTFEKEV